MSTGNINLRKDEAVRSLLTELWIHEPEVNFWTTLRRVYVFASLNFSANEIERPYVETRFTNCECNLCV